MDPKRLLAGAVGGLAGGVLFGMLMQMMGMLPMVGSLVGQDTVAVGWLVHLAISVALGLGFALTLGALSSSWGRAVGFGAVYGAIWWVLGALLIMPAAMDMPIFAVGATQLQSLMGHLIYGLALGIAFQAVLRQTTSSASVPSRV